MNSIIDDINRIMPSEGILVDIAVDNGGDGVLVLQPEDPADPKENGNGDTFRSFHYYGTVIDEETGEPLPGASVIIYQNSQRVGATAADANGEFHIYTDQEGENITVTNVDYQGKNFPATLIRHEFPLKKNADEIEDVTVTATYPQKNNWIWLAVAAAVVYDQSQKKVSGKTNTGINPTWIVLGVGAVLAWPLIKGALNLTELAGDVLSAPADLARALNEEMDQGIMNMAYKQAEGYVSTHKYKRGDKESEYWMEFLKHTDMPNKQYWIDKFKEEKGMTNLLQGVLYVAAVYRIHKLLGLIK